MRPVALALFALFLPSVAFAAQVAPIPAPARPAALSEPTLVTTDATSPTTDATPPATDAAATPDMGTLPTALDQQQDAQAISSDIFGPRVKADAAYGAYQRGEYLTALALALPRAQQDDAAAQTLIGEIYSKGLGVGEDDGRAAGWFEIASRHGDMLAAFELATMYEDGSGVAKDPKRAATLFQQSADAGYMPAKYNLALLYIGGLYVEPNLLKAAALLKEAADSGLPEAQYDYGNLLMQGAGVPPDEKAAARQIGLAAQSGLIAAQVDYATLLYLGNGVPRDLPGAVRWYQQAAAAGNPVAQNRLAKLLAVGEGVNLDLQQAAMWRALARRQGLSDPVLDKLLVSIPTADLAAAEELARFWPSLPPNASTATGTASADAAGQAVANPAPPAGDATQTP